MLNPTLPPRPISEGINSTNVLRAITFEMMDYFFAIPIDVVLKIIICPPIQHPMEQGIGIVDLDGETITVVDLGYKLANLASDRQTSEITSCSPRRFLIVAQTLTGDSCGFIAYKSPSLNDISLSTIRPLPASYGQVTGLGFVNYIGALPQSSESSTVFILGYKG
ncbi:MAG: chemotaxis protein CheW [Xenococcaceae cyanobacterium MO_207.B15]|nr:chemotaxis protein CheW [Xenococcaceae cyanobacterium MO_207.B15]